MSINRIIKRNKIESYGAKSGKSRAKSLKAYASFKRALIYANSLPEKVIEKFERLDQIENIREGE